MPPLAAPNAGRDPVPVTVASVQPVRKTLLQGRRFVILPGGTPSKNTSNNEIFKHMGAELRMLEIGVQSGGSARTWKRYYGTALYYVGVDISPATRRSHSPSEKIFVEIGDQGNARFQDGLWDEDFERALVWPTSEGLTYGALSFDHIARACGLIFVSITMEGWTGFM